MKLFLEFADTAFLPAAMSLWNIENFSNFPQTFISFMTQLNESILCAQQKKFEWKILANFHSRKLIAALPCADVKPNLCFFLLVRFIVFKTLQREKFR
jgi:hypothetical protein